MRLLPELTPETRSYWTGGERHELVLPVCDDCGRAHHPSMVVCPDCRGSRLTPTPVGKGGVVVGVSVNHQPWIPGFDPPYVVAIVELDEQPGLRLTTNIVGCAPDAVHIDMPVKVRFEQWEEVHLPLFEPDPAAAPRAEARR